MLTMRLLPCVALAATAACAKTPGGSVGCGIDALTGPLAVKESFGNGNAVADLPRVAPARLPVRLVAGPVWPGTVTDSAHKWYVTAHGAVSKEAQVGYGVLVVDFANVPLGVMAFNGRTVRGAPDLGTLAIGDTVVPLLAVRIDPAVIQTGICPAFPDSLR